MFQNHWLLPWLTCFDNIYLAAERVFSARETKAQLKGRTDAALALVGLTAGAPKRPGEISGGMKQRGGIARALSMEPQVLLMDEPFGALDAMTRQALQDEMQAIVADTGTTVFFVTHDLEEAAYLGDRIIGLLPHPGRLGMELHCMLPRPRDQLTTRETPDFLQMRHTLFNFIRGAEQ